MTFLQTRDLSFPPPRGKIPRHFAKVKFQNYGMGTSQINFDPLYRMTACQPD